jgi:hypothetical protein
LARNPSDWCLLRITSREIRERAPRIVSDLLEMGLQKVAKRAATGETGQAPVATLRERQYVRVAGKAKLTQRVGVVDHAQGPADVRPDLVKASPTGSWRVQI